MSMYQKLYDKWAELCANSLGYQVPMNHIDSSAVMHIVNDASEPLVTKIGENVTMVRVTYKYEDIIKDKSNIN